MKIQNDRYKSNSNKYRADKMTVKLIQKPSSNCQYNTTLSAP